MTAAARFLLGVRAALPIVIGYVPIAISFGIVARDGGLPLWLAGLMSAIVYAGASQFAAVAMLRLGAPVPEIVLATFFLNLRHLVMSLAIIPKLPPGAGRMAVAAGLTDETFAVASFHPDERLRSLPAMAGLVVTAWASWLLGTLAGGLMADALPRLLTDAMGVALYGLFIGLLVPAVRVVPKGLVAAIAAMAANWAALMVLPPGWAIIAAILAGASVGALATR